MAVAFLLLVAAYLLGSISGSLVLGRFRGVDIRQQGSGNAGGTNALRALGWRFALPVVLIDIGKGALAAWLASRFAPPALLAATLPAAVLVAVVGHVWPVFHGFRGGKGVATLLGGLMVVWPLALPGFALAWLLVFTGTGFVGLASILATATLPLSAAWQAPMPWPHWALAVLAAAFIAFTHRSNLARLRAGTEPRFERARVWARLWSWAGSR